MFYVGYPTKKYDEMKSLYLERLLEFVLVEIGIILLLVWFIVGRRVQPLIQLSEVAKSLAKGDLQVSIHSLKRNDEIKDLSVSIEQMIQNLKSLISQVQETSEQSAAASQQLSASAEITLDTSSNIARSIQDIAEGANIQAIESNKILEKIDFTVQQVTEGYQLVHGTLAQATHTSKDRGLSFQIRACKLKKEGK
jgi:methyl-accepting chemotaxis protein